MTLTQILFLQLRAMRSLSSILVISAAFIFSACSSNQGMATPDSIRDKVQPVAYTLQFSDILDLVVTPRPEITGEYTIGPDGSVTIPLAGSVHVQGLTVNEAEIVLRTALEVHYKSFTLVLKIKEFQNDSQITVLGEVAAPGVYPLVNRMSLSQALGLAGGTTPNADLNQIRIVRNGSEAQVIVVNLNELLKGDLSQDYILDHHDLIYVDRTNFAAILSPLNKTLPLFQFGLLTIISLNQLQY